jgi:hypothetical protein
MRRPVTGPRRCVATSPPLSRTDTAVDRPTEPRSPSFARAPVILVRGHPLHLLATSALLPTASCAPLFDPRPVHCASRSPFPWATGGGRAIARLWCHLNSCPCQPSARPRPNGSSYWIGDSVCGPSRSERNQQGTMMSSRVLLTTGSRLDPLLTGF